MTLTNTETAEYPEDIRQSAEACYAECEQMDSYGIVETISKYLNAERQSCAGIADRMRIKHGSPVMGPYENGVWDQGKRIASLIRREV